MKAGPTGFSGALDVICEKKGVEILDRWSCWSLEWRKAAGGADLGKIWTPQVRCLLDIQAKISSKELDIHMCSLGGSSGLQTDIWELCVEDIGRKGTEGKQRKKAETR